MANAITAAGLTVCAAQAACTGIIGRCRLRPWGFPANVVDLLEHTFQSAVMAQRVEHWFNRRYGMSRRDIYLLRTESGWQVLGRLGGADGQEAVHYFDDEAGARAMLQRMLDSVPPELSNWAKMTASSRR
jgi:hypothetical protein